jgi:arylsulfatase A
MTKFPRLGYDDNSVELYNLKNDISDSGDIAEEMPDKASHLQYAD